MLRAHPTHKVFTIGVAGGTASGKSTISNAILQQVGVENMAHILHDSYYKSWFDMAGLGQGPRDMNFDHPDSLDTALMISHIRRLQSWEPVEMPVYDYMRHQRADYTLRVEPRPVLLIEGILVLAEPTLVELMDMKIFVDTPADIRFIRRLKRDIHERGRSVDSVIEQYERTVRPMHEAFVEPSKRYADVIVPQGGFNQVAINMISDRLRWVLHLRNSEPSHAVEKS